MKQYLSSEQTAKLIELGVEKPWRNEYLHILEEYGYAVEEARNFSIGELIELLPPTIRMKKKNLVNTIARTEYNTFVSYSELDGTPYIAEHGAELIDALYAMIVKLKEEGVI